jgi:hypothetical protein
MTRDITNKILEGIDEGIFNAKGIVLCCLKYMSEADVSDMAKSNMLFEYEDDEDDDIEYIVTRNNYFSVAQGLHWYCQDNYVGQGDILYSVQCQLDYKPAFSENDIYDCGDEDAIEVYELLEAGKLDAEDLLAAILKVMEED